MTVESYSRLSSPAVRAAVESEQVVLQAIDSAARRLISLQAPEGYWVGELEADTTLESDYILLQLWLHPPAGGRWPVRELGKIEEAARYIRERQTSSGGWNIYPGGPDNISASVKGYFALKLAGDSPEAPHMERARQVILSLGGLEKANSYTRIYLSFFGLYDPGKVPTIPPELILLPASSYINIYEMSSWTRAILVPLSILSALRPRKEAPAGFTLSELLLPSPSEESRHQGWSWADLFWGIDRLLKIWESTGFLPQRRQALREAERWVREHLEGSDGLGAIFPSMLNSILALTELGYEPHHPVLRREIDRFEALAIREHGTLRMQPCVSPVWDTSLAAFALGVAGGPRSHQRSGALRRASEWLLSKEVKRRGDWAVKNPQAEPGGWYFEFANEFYPDIDDTAMVLLALERARRLEPESVSPAQDAVENRALAWILSMQSKDGGWAAFDKDNDRWILTQVPFADHNAMLDPACPDITGRVLESLMAMGLKPSHPAVQRAVSYLRKTQEPDGTWPGRWGVNYIYGTCFALRGLRAAGVDPREGRIIQAGEWIRSLQNADGGWGESCASYDDPVQKGCGPSTASQTAWAVMGLLAAGDASTSSVRRGVAYLVESQDVSGGWTEPWFTGTGFPRVFYLRYHMYSQYFPLMALGEYAASRERASL